MSLIDIEDRLHPDNRPVDVPEFYIERDDSSSLPPDHTNDSFTIKKKGRHSRKIAAAIVAAVLILCGIILWFYRYEFIKPDVEFSTSDSKNIELLSRPMPAPASGTTVYSDSILGVAFDMYSLAGLKAKLETVMPDTADNSLVLFMRSADYHPDSRLIGTVVTDGVTIPSKERKSRPAYVAISKEGQIAIGSTLSDRMVRNAEKTGGSFFRQFILLGNGELPENFRLHGKVERAAIGRMADGNMYYIVTRHKETMYDFADALREYGFMDAVYISGGNSYTFHRTSDGIPHITPELRKKYEKYKTGSSVVPLLVFRR